MTLGVERAIGVTVTCLTTRSAGNLPVVLSTLVAANTKHVGQAGALARLPVAGVQPHCPVRAQLVANTLNAVLSQRIAVVTKLALFAVEALSIVQTLETLASGWVATVGSSVVNVAAAFTLLASAVNLCRIAIVVLLTLVTARTWAHTETCHSKSFFLGNKQLIQQFLGLVRLGLYSPKFYRCSQVHSHR